jgi:tetratricopeptide (TPR) repeat protein
MDPFAIEEQSLLERRSSSSYVASALSFFIWGSGQLYNGDLKKAAIFFSTQLVLVLYLWDYFTGFTVYQVLVGVIGPVAYALFIFLVSLFGLAVWVFNVVDAHRTAGFLEMVATRTLMDDGLSTWDFADERSKAFPWGSVFIYVFLILAIVKYLFFSGRSELQNLIQQVENNPSNYKYRISLVKYYLDKDKLQHAILELEDYEEYYGADLSPDHKKQLASILGSLNKKRNSQAFSVIGDIQSEKKKKSEEVGPDWKTLHKILSWDDFREKSQNWLHNHKADPELLRILVNEYMGRENWATVKELSAIGLRVLPHDAWFLGVLASAENKLFQQKQVKVKKSTQKRAFITAVNRFQAEDKEGALKALEQYFQSGGGEKEAYQLQNLILIQLGNYKEAVSGLKKALVSFPEESDFLEALGRAYFKLGDHLQAIQSFKALAEEAPSKVLYKNIGVCYKRMGRYGDAVEYYQKGLRLAPDDQLLLFLMGYSQLELKNYKMAKRYYEKLRKLNPRYPHLNYYLGQARERLGLLEGAVRIYKQVDKSSKMYSIVQQKLKLLRAKISRIKAQRQKRLEEAKVVDSVQPKIKPVPKVEPVVTVPKQKAEKPVEVAQPVLHVNKKTEPKKNKIGVKVEKIDQVARLIEAGERAYADEEWQQAERYYVKALVKEPTNFHCTKQLGRLYFEVHSDYQKAEGYLAKAVIMRPDDVWVNLALGVIARASEQTDKAVRYFRKVLMIEPTNFNANLNLALIYEDRNQVEKAKDFYLAVIANHPGQQLAYNYLGDIYFNEGDFFRAQEMYREIVKISPENAGIRFKMALCLERTGDFSSAIQELEALQRVIQGEVFMEKEVATALQRVRAKL